MNPSVSILKLRGENDNHNKMKKKTNKFSNKQKKLFFSDENGTKEFTFLNWKQQKCIKKNKRIRRKGKRVRSIECIKEKGTK